MYCNKCGKEIEQGNLCKECEAAEEKVQSEVLSTPETEPVVEAVPAVEAEPINKELSKVVFVDEIAPATSEACGMPEPHNRMFGFGRALTSTILSNVGFIFVYASLLVSAVAEIGAAIVLIILSLPLIIIPFIFGILSIKVFKSRKASCVKPVPTLILGIVGLATSAFSAFFAFISFILAVSMAML